MASASTTKNVDNYSYVGPGQLFNKATGQVETVTYEQDGFVIDTVQFSSGLQTTAPQMFFSQPSTSNGAKDVVDTNVSAPGKIPYSSWLELHRVGVYVHMAFGNVVAVPADLKAALENLALLFKINKREIVNGPVICQPSGYGLAGFEVDNAAGIVSNGVCSSAAAADLMDPILITQDHTITAQCWFASRAWASGWVQPTTTNAIQVKLILSGRVIDPAFI